MKKILKWAAIVAVVLIVIGAVFYDEDDEKNSDSTRQTTERVSKNDLSVSDFKLGENISKTVSMLKSKGWVPGDGEYGEMLSYYSGGIFSSLSAYGYIKSDGRFEGYAVPFVQVSYDEYGMLAHYQIAIRTTFDSAQMEKQLAELDAKEEMLTDSLDDGSIADSADIFDKLEKIDRMMSRITPEIQAEFDSIQEERRLVVEQTQNAIYEQQVEFCMQFEERCLLQYGFSRFEEEDGTGDSDTLIFGYKNSSGDICKFRIERKSFSDTSYTLDYVSARYRGEEKITNQLMKEYLGY